MIKITFVSGSPETDSKAVRYHRSGDAYVLFDKDGKETRQVQARLVRSISSVDEGDETGPHVAGPQFGGFDPPSGRDFDFA
jgi:hypothetical protein